MRYNFILMKTYDWILFDADETLFRFDAFRGMQLTFERFGVQFDEQIYQEYHSLNKLLWVEFQNGRITPHDLKIKRFQKIADQFQLVPMDLHNAFMTAVMTQVCAPVDGAVSLLESLKGRVKIGIITNGFTDFQHDRIELIGLKNHIDLVVISEEVGIAKPHPGIFEHAFELMGNPPREKILMVGDTLETDILGGNNAGIDTCWLNRENKPVVENISFHYQIESLEDLKDLVIPEHARG
jgi:5'-nucleotidase